MFEQKEPVSHYVNVEGYEIHVTEWGLDNPNAILMWHGLARTGRDFDHIAQALSSEYRILCPDTLGRGLSQWAHHPEHEYCFDFYEKLAAKICEIFGLYMFDYIGTSMGGALGIRLAGGLMKPNINKLVINDIAPQLAQEAVERILTYAGSPPAFDTLEELEDYFRNIYTPYGHLSEDQWRHMCETSFRRMDNGQITVHYDPAMVQQFEQHPHDYDMWDLYEKIDCPTLLLRGSSSDLLLPEWAERMTQTGPKAQLVEIPGCGHAPALNKTAQTQIVEEFFKIMNGDEHIKQLLKDGLGKFNMDESLDKQDDPRTQAPGEVPSFDDLGYEYETNPVLKKRVEKEIEALKKKDGI